MSTDFNIHPVFVEATSKGKERLVHKILKDGCSPLSHFTPGGDMKITLHGSFFPIDTKD